MPKGGKKESQERLARIFPSLLAPIIATVVGILASVSMSWFTGRMSVYVVVGIGFVVLLMGTTILVSSFRRGPTKVAALKDSLIKAFCGAIESSPLNPKTMRGGSNS